MSTQSENQYHSSDEITIEEIIQKIKNWFNYLKSKLFIIFAMAVIGGIVGFEYASFQKPTYTATLTFALEDDKNGSSGLSGALGLASSLGFDLGTNAGGAFNGANLIELMKSRRLVEQALLNQVMMDGKPISFAEMYIRFNKWREGWQKKEPELNMKLQFLPYSKRSQFSLQQDSILGNIYSSLIKKNLIVEQKDKKISIISIDVKTENEMFSKYFAETLAKEVSDFYIDTKSKKAKLNVAILEKQADSIRAELNSAITGVAVANDNTYNLNPALNVKRAPSARRQVDVQANTAILTELVKNLELAKVTLRKETPLIQIIDTPILPLKVEKVGKLNSLIMGGFVAASFSLLLITGSFWWKKVRLVI